MHSFICANSKAVGMVIYMSLYTFKIIDTIAKEKSFSKAAESLNMTPSAVSHAVGKLENELGLQLFARNRNGARLTRDGETLFPCVHAIQQYYELFYLRVAQIHGNVIGSVRLGTFNSVTVSWLPQFLKTFRSDYPGIEISIHQGNSFDIANWLETDEVDLAFVVNHTVPPNVDTTLLYQDPLVCIAPTDYVPPNDSYVTPEDISHMNLILQQDGYNTEVLDFLNQNHIKVTPSFYVETNEAIFALVSSGFGFGIVSSMGAPAFDVHTYPINPPAHRNISLASVRHLFSAPATAVLQNAILSYVKQDHQDHDSFL